jgi:4-hydroxy-3-methylbut-2-en-1-yl diphosphate reductase
MSLAPDRQPSELRVLLAAPRAFCAGVTRAIETVETLLERQGPPVYVRHQIVHNEFVVRRLERAGAVFVEDEREIPRGAICVLSAHGVAPSVRARCRERELDVVDATCPLVAKVHVEARRFADSGHLVVLLGHRGHAEVVGTFGERPAQTVVVGSVEDVERLQPDGRPVALITQTTLSEDDVASVRAAVERRVGLTAEPSRADRCYATQNRQAAVRAIADHASLVLVVGSTTSSNAQRLVEIAGDANTDALLMDGESPLPPDRLSGHATIGLTAAASTPEQLVEDTLLQLRRLGYRRVEQVGDGHESAHFKLPRGLSPPARAPRPPDRRVHAYSRRPGPRGVSM